MSILEDAYHSQCARIPIFNEILFSVTSNTLGVVVYMHCYKLFIRTPKWTLHRRVGYNGRYLDDLIVE